MSLRGEAHLDLIEILHDEETGGDLITITSPEGSREDFRALSNDIHLSIDPGTGDVVTGRQASITVAISDLISVGFQNIRGIPDSNSRPWVVTAEDANDVSTDFKVIESHPDRGIGSMTLFLELYESE